MGQPSMGLAGLISLWVCYSNEPQRDPIAPGPKGTQQGCMGLCWWGFEELWDWMRPHIEHWGSVNGF